MKYEIKADVKHTQVSFSKQVANYEKQQYQKRRIPKQYSLKVKKINHRTNEQGVFVMLRN